MFYGEKLTDLRELYGLSRKELADSLHLTEQAIWQYETNTMLPKIEVINEMRSLFQIDAKYLFSNNYLKEKNFSEEKVAYRAKDRESRKKTKFELMFLTFVDYYINYFEEPLIIPDAPILKLQRDSKSYLENANDLDRKELISKVAMTVRRKLGLTDNKDLMYILERSGIYIVEKNLGAEIDAYSTITAKNRSYIVLGTHKKSAVRRNFDLAHELGHLILHGEIDMDILSASELKDIEKEANYFASAFLLPEAEFRQDFMELARKSNPDYYLELKRKYLVSISALEMRAYDLKLMTYQENRYFWGLLTKKGYKLFEPLDDEIHPIRPGRIRSLVSLVFDNKVIQPETFLAEFHILPKFLETLFGFDAGFLNNYLETKKDYFTDAKVVDISNFRR